MAQLPATRANQTGPPAQRRDHPLARLQRDFDMLLDTLWGGPLTPALPGMEALRVWDFDVTENDKEIVVRAELPGFEENEIDVQLHNDILTIKAEKEQKGERAQEYRSFFRSITLPSGIDAEKVQASYRNGVLELHIPRAEGTQPKRIQVQRQEAAASSGGDQAQPMSNQAEANAGTRAKQ